MSRFAMGILLTGLLLSAAARGEFLMPDSRAYRDVDALQVRGHRIVAATTIRPYTRRQVAMGVLRLAAGAKQLSEYERQIVDRLMSEFSRDLPDSLREGAAWWIGADVNPRAIATSSPARIDRPRAYRLPAAAPADKVRLINTLDVVARVSDNVTTGQRFEMDTDGVGDSNYPGGDTYRLGSSGYVDAAYVNYESGWGYASFGKAPAMWGPGRQGNLLISENAPSVVRIAAQVRLRWLHFAAFSGELQPGRDGDGVKANRFLAGHRLVMTPFSWLEIGFAEVVLYGGSGAGISYRRSNPLTWFFAEEVNTNRYGEDTNGLASADVTVRPVPGAEAYVSVLIDDVSLDGKSPHRVGGTAGARWEAPFGWDRAGLGAEYTMVTRWMYNNGNSVPHMRYSNGSAALGHYLGPDGDALFLEGYWENAGGYRASCALTHRRRGETRFDSRYPVDAQGANFGYSCDPFPFGTVDSRTAGEIAIEAPPMRGAVVTLGFRATRTENADNARHDPEWGIGFRADLDWHLPLRY